MRPTLIFIRHHELNGRLFHHGSELPPNLLSVEQLDQLLDKGFVRETPERRSLFRLFAQFSDCTEREALDADELRAYALTD
jgi:hypothetical protein